MLAKASPMLDIRAVTSAAGNQTIEKTTENALRVCTLLGIGVPVAMGLPGPLLSDPITAGSIHGKTGLDGPKLPRPAMEPSPMGAVELMAKVLRESAEPVTIVATGPETNVAALLLAHPGLKRKIARISVMGGGLAHGNWTPAAEFNLLADPEAAEIVFSSGVLIQMSGLDVTERALVLPEDFARIRSVGNQVAGVVADWLEFFYRFHREIGYAGAPVHDAVAVASLLRPELFAMRDLYVAVETAGEYCRGATVGDMTGRCDRPPNVRCVLDVDRQGFVDLLADAVRAYDGWEVPV
jgi:pyrimidine-specific ribonucleoside hydrolase